MTIERQLQLFNEMLDWASEMYDNFELYEWCRNQCYNIGGPYGQTRIYQLYQQ